MRKEIDISPDYLLEDGDYIKVIDQKEDVETAKKGNGAIIFLLTCALAATIILCSTIVNISRKNNNDEKTINNKTNVTTEQKNTINIKDNTDNTTQEKVKKEEPTVVQEDVEEVVEENNIGDKEIDYSNVPTFYNHITENRAKYGSFAESFQTEDDVKNFINFLYKFDELYDNVDTPTTINSQEEYDKIIQDYYGSCVKHDIKGELNLLYSNNKLAQNKIAEAESLAYDLKNGKGKDYTIANRYYTWFLVNLIDDRTKVDATTNNAPAIDGLREQFEQYRYSGNMLNARKYQKNDSLPVDSIHLYYADEAPEGVEITEIQNSLTCPDWGVDNVISKYEEDTEKKLYIKRDGVGTFHTIDEQFEMVLNKGKVR